MTPRAALIAAVELLAMAVVIGIYVAAARRYRWLWHPSALFGAVVAVGILVSIAGEALLHGRSGAFAAMFQRAAIGSAGWGAIIAASVSIIRRLFLNSPRAGR